MVNFDIVNQIIAAYKRQFHEIHKEEQYKWEAVQWFQEHWKEDSVDFKQMLLQAIEKTGELMDAKIYYPKRMLTEFLNYDPGSVRSLFQKLYDESVPLFVRLEDFIGGMEKLHQQYLPERLNPYQDTRAAMVYLTLRYPDQYFLYKYKMFAEFAKLVEYPHRINRWRRIENVLLYQTLAEIICERIREDQELLAKHHMRLNETHYPDTSYHLLTQDIIYASTNYFSTAERLPDESFQVTLVQDQVIVPGVHHVVLQGRHVEYLQRAMQQKVTGELGEEVVLDFERARLKEAGVYDKHPEPASKIKGDGIGYDIDSFDERGTPIFIEVKTTRTEKAPFYITDAELEKSKLAGPRYFLYRVFDFNQQSRRCKIIIHQGSLEKFCINPVAYIVPYDLAKR